MLAMSPNCLATIASAESLGQMRENAADYVTDDSGAVVYIFDSQAPSAEPEKWTDENRGTYSAEAIEWMFPHRPVKPVIFLADHKP